MSNFTYEVDERNLRLKMKEFTVPVKEEAWQKFESYSEGMHSQNRESRLKSFNFSLNRNVVLPSVFGVVIILFSFLLVNFVSIKSSKGNDQKAEAAIPAPAAAPQEQPKQHALPAVKPKQQTEMAKQGDTIPDVKPEDKALLNTLVSASVASPEQTPEAPAQVISAEPTGDSIAKNTDEDAKARRRAERRAARAEAKKLEEMRPVPVAEEQDVEEVRPD